MKTNSTVNEDGETLLHLKGGSSEIKCKKLSLLSANKGGNDNGIEGGCKAEIFDNIKKISQWASSSNKLLGIIKNHPMSIIIK